MLVEGFPAQAFGTNCFVVAPGPGEQCVVLDPGIGVTGQLDDVLSHHRLHPVAVLLTHGHLDHTFSVVPVCQARDVPAWIHPADRGQLSDPLAGLGIRPGSPLPFAGGLPAAEPDDVRELSDGASLELAGLNLTVDLTPGHTPGSVTFATADGGPDGEPVLFTGDLLFAGSIGRMDLPGGSQSDMVRSLTASIVPRRDETVVHPGHGPSTTIGRERATNPYLRELT